MLTDKNILSAKLAKIIIALLVFCYWMVKNVAGTHCPILFFTDSFPGINGKLICVLNRDGLLLRTQADEMVSQLHTNLLGTMLTCKVAVKSMIQQQGGAIVNIGMFPEANVIIFH